MAGSCRAIQAGHLRRIDLSSFKGGKPAYEWWWRPAADAATATERAPAVPAGLFRSIQRRRPRSEICHSASVVSGQRGGRELRERSSDHRDSPHRDRQAQPCSGFACRSALLHRCHRRRPPTAARCRLPPPAAAGEWAAARRRGGRPRDAAPSPP